MNDVFYRLKPGIPKYVAGFYLSLGLSLLVSAGQYIVAGIRSSIRARNVF